MRVISVNSLEDLDEIMKMIFGEGNVERVDETNGAGEQAQAQAIDPAHAINTKYGDLMYKIKELLDEESNAICEEHDLEAHAGVLAEFRVICAIISAYLMAAVNHDESNKDHPQLFELMIRSLIGYVNDAKRATVG